MNFILLKCKKKNGKIAITLYQKITIFMAQEVNNKMYWL